MGKPPKVLITKLASMGDLIHLLPALTDAQKAYPGIVFDWIVDKNFQEVASWHPSVNKIIQTNHRHWRRNLTKYSTFKEISSAIKEIKQTNYDIVIDAQGNIKSAILSLFAKGKVAGFDGKSVPEWGSHFLYKKKAKASKKLHAIERLRILFAFALNYEVPNTPPDYQIQINKLLKPSVELPKEPFLVLVPIASHPSKLWEESLWKELIEKLLDLGYFILIPSGNGEEMARAKRLSSHKNVTALPKLSLSEVAYIIKKATAMISLDTGLSHIAAALGTPNITLYGPTNPSLTGTIGKNQKHISHSDLSAISVQTVLEEFITQ